jgi:hypothetical protein
MCQQLLASDVVGAVLRCLELAWLSDARPVRRAEDAGSTPVTGPSPDQLASPRANWTSGAIDAQQCSRRARTALGAGTGFQWDACRLRFGPRTRYWIA